MPDKPAVLKSTTTRSGSGMRHKVISKATVEKPQPPRVDAPHRAQKSPTTEDFMSPRERVMAKYKALAAGVVGQK